MRKVLLTISFVLSSFFLSHAQNNVSEIIGAGLIAAEEYSTSYLTPAAESFTFNLATGWYDEAKVLKKWQFEISARSQATFNPEEKKTFVLNPQVYADLIQGSYDAGNNTPASIAVTFGDGSPNPRAVPTIFGVSDPAESLIITAIDDVTGQEIDRGVIDLGQGLRSNGIDFVPTGYIQAGIGLGAGLELKARFVPTVEYYESETSLYGGALQWEISKLLENGNGKSIFPLRLALLAGFTQVDAVYDFEDGTLVDGVGQNIEISSTSYTFAAIASTRWDVFNFFGGINYASGTTKSDLLGTYTIQSNSVVFPVNTTFTDPLSIETNASAMMGTLGAKLSIWFLSIHGSYTFAEYPTANASIAFKF